MKKTILSIFLILLIILSSCSTAGDVRSSLGANTSKSNEINIYYPRFMAFTPSNEHIEQWESYMKDKYNIKINLSYTPKLLDAPANTTVYVWKDEDGHFNTSQGVDIETLVELSGTNGFVYVESFEMLNTLIQSDLIMPVDSFIASISTLANLTPDVLDQFSDSNGNLWAIPLASTGAIRSKRTYNKAWLDKAGITDPKSIEEFFNFAKFIASEDPDGNGKKDSYIMEYSNSSFLFDFADIFRAFGCYTYNGLPVAYNPHKNKLENIALSDNFTDAISFIDLLIEEKLIINTTDAKKLSIDNYMIGSSFVNKLPYNYVSDRLYSYYLKGLNSTFLVEETFSLFCLAVLKYSDSIEENLNQFFNIIHSNSESRFDLQFGIKGADYFDEGGYFDYVSTSKDGSPLPNIGMSVGLSPYKFEEKPFIRVDNHESLGKTSNISKIIETFKENREIGLEAEQYIGTNLSYINPFTIFIPELSEINGDVSSMFSQLVIDILENNISVEEVLVKYNLNIERMTRAEVILDIDELNSLYFE